MRKGKHVIGQSVLSYADGTRVDNVKDLIIGASNEEIVALLVDEGGLLSSSRVIPIENVHRFGKDAVVIESVAGVVNASADPDVNSIVSRKETLLGKKVMTDQGRDMGSISDMYFDDENGRIHGFEVSTGLLGDAAKGTSFLPVDRIDRMGPDVIFVLPETGEQLDSQVGGIQGALSDAGAKIGDATSKAGSSLQSTVSDKEPEQSLLGKRSGQDVTDENGRIVVANGERIRAEHIEWAKQSDNVGTLTAAATAGEASELRDKAGSAVESAADSLGSMWDRFVTRLGEVRDDQGKQADAAQTAQRLAAIQDAIGRPMMKVILDKNDNVILDFGDIVTHQAIQQAFDSNMLDTLLESVHRATVSFPNEQLRAEAPASATVNKSSGGATVVDELEQKVEKAEQEKSEQQEQQKAESEQARKQREHERQERASEREEADQQRTEEVKEAKASATSDSGDSGAKAAQPVGPGRAPALTLDASSRDDQGTELVTSTKKAATTGSSVKAKR